MLLLAKSNTHSKITHAVESYNANDKSIQNFTHFNTVRPIMHII